MSNLEQLLVDAGLGRHAADLAALARDSVHIEPRRVELTDLPLGASRFGGVPDLPVGFVWPTYQGRPHAFLAQIRLSDVPATDALGLPATGWLAFFYELESFSWGFDPEDRGCSHVAYFDLPPNLLQRTPPPAGADEGATFHACALSFAERVDLPDAGDFVTAAVFERMTESERSAYGEVCSSTAPSSYHHLGGQPQLIQNDMRLECQLASNGFNAGTPEGYEEGEELLPGAADWELLLQVDTDDTPEWMWGDVGRLYFWLRKQDRIERRFDRSWLVLQCG